MAKKIRYKEVIEYFLKHGYTIERHGSHIVIRSPSNRLILLPQMRANSAVSHMHTAVIKHCLQSESEEDLECFEAEVEAASKPLH